MNLTTSNLEPALSVVMPVYNAARWLRECLERILSQDFTDFELIVADDGSTDESRAIVRSFADARIRLLELPHDYIGTLNRMLAEVRGRYICRMDADDLMMPGRLRCQFEYMEAHPKVDVWCGGLCYVNNEDKVELPSLIGQPYRLRDILPRNYFPNPSTIIRTSSLRRMGVAYEREYIYAEDYRFWSRLIHAGARIVCTDRIFMKFRDWQGQTTKRHMAAMAEAARRAKDEVEAWISDEAYAGYVEPAVRERGRKLTVIIPFLNEGEEIVETVRSVRATAGDAVEIFTINDQSVDGYPYEEELHPYDVHYFVNLRRKGVAASRDFGVSRCRSPYFLLLDGHMRFYAEGWAQRLVDILEADDRRLLCCQGRYLQKVDGVVQDYPRKFVSFGAYMPYVKGRSFTEVYWHNEETRPGEALEPIPVVLGAGYAASKRYWDRLHGLVGLRSYGSDEAYLSLKVWMEGGSCQLVKDVIAGHIYRTVSPFRRFTTDELYNQLLIARLLYPQSWRCMAFATACLSNPDGYAEACRWLEAERPRWDAERAYLHGIFTRSFRDFLRQQAALCPQKLQAKLAKIDRADEVARFLVGNDVTDCGLCEGKTGQLLWLSLYARATGDRAAEDAASDRWQDVVAALEAGRLPANFRYGVAGVGWALLYLCANGLVDDDPAPWLALVDARLAPVDPTLCDPSFFLGAGGLLAYATARLAYALRRGEALPWTDDRMARLRQAAAQVVEARADLDAVTHALRFLALADEGRDAADFSLSLTDWLTFTDFVPLNPERWDCALTGNALSTTAHALLLRERLHENS